MSPVHSKPSFLVPIPIRPSTYSSSISFSNVCSPIRTNSTTSQSHFTKQSLPSLSTVTKQNRKYETLLSSHKDQPVPKRKRPSTKHSSSNSSAYTRAVQLSYRRDKRPARAAFRSAIVDNPSDPRLWLAWGQMESRVSNYIDARNIFQEAVSKHPRNTRLLHAWAVSEQRAGIPTRANALFRRCIHLKPNDGIAWQALALLYEEQQQYQAARDTFQQGVQQDPENAYLWSAWGVMEHRRNEFQRACELFGKAIDVDPMHARTYQAWAITREKMGLHHKSAALFRQALEINPTSAPTYQAFALFEARRGQFDQARDLFQKGAKIDPTHAPIWHAWAVMEKEQGAFDVARELFQKGIKAAPNNTAMLRAWASMELDLGHIDKSSDWMVPRGKRKHVNVDKQEFVTTGDEKKNQDIKGGVHDETASQIQKRRPNSRRDRRQISEVGENLQMLRLMIERRSDDDVTTVMQWLNKRSQTDRKLYDAIAERRDSDMRKVSKWIGRRSASDIEAFKQWLGERYEKDRRIGVYIFNWNVPPRVQAPVAIPAEVSTTDKIDKPIEWLQLSERPEPSLQTFDEEIYCSQDPTDYADGIYFLGQVAEGLVDRAALLLVLGAITLGLVGTTVELFDKGYSPSGDSAQMTASSPTPPPSGVDAQLYEEGGAESATTEVRQRALSK